MKRYIVSALLLSTMGISFAEEVEVKLATMAGIKGSLKFDDTISVKDLKKEILKTLKATKPFAFLPVVSAEDGSAIPLEPADAIVKDLTKGKKYNRIEIVLKINE